MKRESRPLSNPMETPLVMATPELIGIIIGVLTILIAIIGMGIMIIQKIDSGDSRTEAKVDAARTELKSEITEVDAKIDIVKTEVDAKIDGVRTDLDTKIEGVRTEVNAKIEGVRTELKAEIAESGARAEAQGALIIAELRGLRESMEGRLNGIEREQARQEGVLSVLVQRDRAARRGDEAAGEESSSAD